MQAPPRVCRLLLPACLALGIGSISSTSYPAPQQPDQGAAAAATPVDVLVVDRDGRLVENVRPADLSVTVDGKPRQVLWVRRVSRGPGALTDARSRQRASDSNLSFATEARRNVLIVIDQSTLLRGDEGTVVKAAAALLDRLGIDDRIAVLRIPVSSDTSLTLTTERPEARQVLARVTGEAWPGRTATLQDPDPQADLVAVVDPDPDKVTDPERQVAFERPPGAPVPSPGDEGQAARGSLAAVTNLLAALEKVPGRKVVALFSAGFAVATQAHVREAAVLAARSRTIVYAYGLRGNREDPRNAPDASLVESLARSTGGTWTALGRNPERTMERTVAELSACYVVGIADDASDADGRRHALRVEPAKRGPSVQSAAWLPRAVAIGDETLPPPGVPEPPSPGVAPVPEPPRAPDQARGAELQLALARLFDYAGGYEKQYSMLVAEEEYRQHTDTESQRLRSDFLLVRSAGQWISFRDVFEVDGKPVRDRDERLARLFLDPSPEARARMLAIRDESARYNIGPVIRTVNVPLFPLSFLTTYNRLRFAFDLDGERDAAGVRVWRVTFTEFARPTLVVDLNDNDVPTTGWFLVEKLTGAIVETGVRFSKGDDSRSEVTVGYRRNDQLGLWVPDQMREVYSNERFPYLDARATYSNFRRFQVKTEEKIVVPKR